MMKSVTQRLKESLMLPLSFVSILWIVHAVDATLSLELSRYGIYPNELFGLTGIVFAPFLHADLGHLFSNSPPLLILGTTILFSYRRVALHVVFLVWSMSGLGVWLFARPSYHIGASGIIYGLAAFVFFSGVFRRDVKSIALALLVAFYYGGMLAGIVPQGNNVSWESHLLGALSGLGCAWWFRKVDPPPKYDWEEEEEREREGEYDYWNYRKW